MSNLYNYVFWFNSYQSLWHAIPRDQYTAFFSGHLEFNGVLKSKSIETLIFMIDHPEEPIVQS